MSEIDFNTLQKEAREEFEAEKSYQSSGGAGGLMVVDGMGDDYDYYESQPARQDRIKSRAKPFGRLPFHPSMIQRTRKHAGPQLREKAGDVLATLIVDGYTTAVGFGDPEHQHKRNWKKKYYSDVNDLERAALAAKLKQQGINGGPYMKWLSITKPHKVREIKLHSFRAFTANAKKFINANGGAQLPMTIKQQIMASAWNSIVKERIAYRYCSTIFY
ncbi:MAG: hypothetical protein EZS28_015205 [Streblomastix strix]|uniref:Uncharacterized protein n=1 Tax=Streblomastix strix TaxID=222440 RepID=A0A5J4W328_9EUKA|nr:MAG: hypothetical protein EZS28_015205 [Streblomastix strix]